MCFAKHSRQLRLASDDAKKIVQEIRLGSRKTNLQVSRAPSLAAVERIVRGHVHDSLAFPRATYLHEHVGGDVCAGTGEGRSATVAYYCDQSLADSAFRMQVSEPSPCKYVMLVNTSMVC